MPLSFRPAVSTRALADAAAEDAVNPALADMASAISADWTTVRAAYYVATVVGAGVVLYCHWGLLDIGWLLSRKRLQKKERPQLRPGAHTVRYFATALAGVAFANAMVALVGENDVLVRTRM